MISDMFLKWTVSLDIEIVSFLSICQEEISFFFNFDFLDREIESESVMR
jgi:hypothetical protein